MIYKDNNLCVNIEKISAISHDESVLTLTVVVDGVRLTAIYEGPACCAKAYNDICSLMNDYDHTNNGIAPEDWCEEY